MKKLYGDRLVELRLYGSRGRGDHSEDSDIDLLVIIRDLTDFWREFKKISKAASEISLNFDVVISAIPMAESEWKVRNSPLIMNARREGLVVV